MRRVDRLASTVRPSPAPGPAHARGPIVFMGLLGLQSHNREEEQLVLRLVDRGHEVLYLTPLGVRDPRLADVLASLRRLRQARPSSPRTGLRTATLLVLPWRALRPVAWLNRRLVRWRLERALRSLSSRRPVLWLRLPTPELVTQLDALNVRAVVYECIDNYSAYPHYRLDELRRLERCERQLVHQADLLVTLSAVVARRFPEAAARTRVVPLGVDLERFDGPPGAIPADLARLPRPRLGLVGGLDDRVDFALLRHVAMAEPTWSLVLIGPWADRLDPRRLVPLPNIHAFGPRPYERVPAYLAGLDVCLIPYRQCAWTDGCFPAKLHEYLASGRPVVATNLPGLAAHAEVLNLGGDADEFLAACRRAVVDHDVARATRRQAVARAHSLEARCRVLDALLNSLVA